jgi:hypothetical protein
MFRYKFLEADIKKAIKYLKTKKGKLQQKPWVTKFEKDLKVDKHTLRYKGLEIIPKERIDAFLRKRILSKEADISTSRDSAYYQISKENVGVSRRDIMEWLRKQKSLGENREALRTPQVKKGPKLNGFVFETDLVFIKRDDLIAQNPRFERTGYDIQYCVTTVEKTTGLTRLDHSIFKRQADVTPIVKRQLTEMCAQLGVSPKKVALWSDKGGEFSKPDLEKFVRDYRYVTLGSSCENKNKIFQRVFYRILKNRQAIDVKTAIKKCQVQMNKSLLTLHKMSANEVAEKVKRKEINSLKVYNSSRKDHVSNTKTKELQVGDMVRLLVKKTKLDSFYKSYKNKTFTAQVFKIVKKTKKAPYKYKVEGKSRYFLIDYLLKSALRDTKSKDLIKGRDLIQGIADKAMDKKERVKFENEIEANRKRLLDLQAKGDVVLPTVDRGIKNLNKIRHMQAKSEKVLAAINDYEQEQKRKAKEKGYKLIPLKPIKYVGIKVKDAAYDPIEDIMDLDEDEPKPKKPKKVKPKPKPKRKARQVKPQRKPKNAPFYEQFGPSGDIPTDEEEEKAAKKKKRVPVRRQDVNLKKRLVKEYTAQGHKVLRMQKRFGKVKGDKLDRLIRDIEIEITKGQEMAKVIKAKKYKKTYLNLSFFSQ